MLHIHASYPCPETPKLLAVITNQEISHLTHSSLLLLLLHKRRLLHEGHRYDVHLPLPRDVFATDRTRALALFCSLANK